MHILWPIRWNEQFFLCLLGPNNFLCEVFSSIFFKLGCVCFLILICEEFFIYFINRSSTHILSNSGLPFHSLNGVFWWLKLLILIIMLFLSFPYLIYFVLCLRNLFLPQSHKNSTNFNVLFFIMSIVWNLFLCLGWSNT